MREWRDKHRIVVDGHEPRRWRVDRDASDQLLDATRDPQHDAAESIDFQRERTRKEKANADIAELKAAELRGDLVSRRLIESTVSAFVAEHRERLLSMPARIAADMAAELGCDRIALESALDRMVTDHLSEMARSRLRLAGGDAVDVSSVEDEDDDA